MYSKELKVKVWKKFKLEDVREALQALFAKERDGRNSFKHKLDLNVKMLPRRGMEYNNRASKKQLCCCCWSYC